MRFYRVSPMNPTMELPTCFGWDQWPTSGGLQPTFPGFEFAYQWDNGKDDHFLPGNHFCGSPAEWLDGTLSSVPVPTFPLTGTPVCCGPGVLVLSRGCEHGGVVYAGIVLLSRGEEAGGFASSSLALKLFGGEEQGGTALSKSASAAHGGEEHGGGVASSAVAFVAGGQESGGSSSQNSYLALSRGGSEEGLTEPPTTSRVQTTLCPGSISSRLLLTNTGKTGTCTCVPNKIQFIWNGSLWQSVTSSMACVGTNTINWSLLLIGTPGHLFLNDTAGIHGPFAGTCVPFNFMFPMFKSGGYCTGTWTSTVTEE